MPLEFISVATSAAWEAGALLRQRFGRPVDVQHKGTFDLVTEADRAAEALIAGHLRAAFPDHRLLGEEGARALDPDAARSPYRWVVDPLAGPTPTASPAPGGPTPPAE